MERCCRARRSRAPSPSRISPRCCAWLGATDRSLASSSRISPSSIPRSWDSSASHPTAPPLPNSNPPGNDQMSGCPADRELPPHRWILCQPDRGIPIYQSAGQRHSPSITFTSGLSAVRVVPVSCRTELQRHTLHPQVQQIASLHPSPSTAGLPYNRSELPGRVKTRPAFWLTFRPARAGAFLTDLHLNQYSIAAAQPGLAAERVLNLHLPVPSKQEQQHIANHIGVSTDDIADAMARARRQIELLQEYGTRHIADVVTGKLDVPATAAQLPDQSDDEKSL